MPDGALARATDLRLVVFGAAFFFVVFAVLGADAFFKIQLLARASILRAYAFFSKKFAHKIVSYFKIEVKFNS
ncbi:MAG TPA: hypothetical protein PLW39_11275 [Thermoflexales bacterium]|nr:hypothetical protein [Thermoflexales bacterium]